MTPKQYGSKYYYTVIIKLFTEANFLIEKLFTARKIKGTHHRNIHSSIATIRI